MGNLQIEVCSHNPAITLQHISNTFYCLLTCMDVTQLARSEQCPLSGHNLKTQQQSDACYNALHVILSQSALCQYTLPLPVW